MTTATLSTMRPLVLPELPYPTNALEPVISEEIMRLHHSKHHQAYVTNFNAALEKLNTALTNNNLSDVINLQAALRFNGGGHINHSIFWKTLAPEASGGGKIQEGTLLAAIRQDFGSLEKLMDEMTQRSVAIQGSGWGWLGYNKAHKRLEIATCENQDPLSLKGLMPLFGIDVWEHAYYLQYKNVRADYVKALWQIVNWKEVDARLTECMK